MHAHVQRHATTTGGMACAADGRLILLSSDLRDVFIASTAELPGLLISALIMDKFGRKWSGTLITLPETLVPAQPMHAHGPWLLSAGLLWHMASR